MVTQGRIVQSMPAWLDCTRGPIDFDEGVAPRQLASNNNRTLKLTRFHLSWRVVAAASGFEENLDNAVNHLKLLRVALGEERINALADVSWIFFPFQE